MSDDNLLQYLCALFLSSDACELEPDPNPASRNLNLSDNSRKVTAVQKEQPYPDQPERSDCCQLLSRSFLAGRCYWEAEWRGCVGTGVTYRGIRRRGNSAVCLLGRNPQSWSLKCSDGGYSVWHNNRETALRSLSRPLPTEWQCRWTVLLALGPFTESPLTHGSSSTPSTPHSLNRSVLGFCFTGFYSSSVLWIVTSSLHGKMREETFCPSWTVRYTLTKIKAAVQLSSLTQAQAGGHHNLKPG